MTIGEGKRQLGGDFFFFLLFMQYKNVMHARSREGKKMVGVREAGRGTRNDWGAKGTYS